MKTFLGKTALGIVRLSVWIGPDGRVCKVWDKVRARGHASEVLQAIRMHGPAQHHHGPMSEAAGPSQREK